MAVAKTYQSWGLDGEPYIKNGRQYIVAVRPGNGTRKEVRWYTDAEYAKMYPEDAKPAAADTFTGGKKIRSYKDTLGFKEGYITIFKGDTYALLDWFRESVARYHNYWGWYISSEFELPQLPAGITPVKLMWVDVAYADEDQLKSESAIKEILEGLLYDEGTSQFQGTIGERLELELFVKKVIDLPNGYFGSSKMHIFTDANDNEYVWTTGSKTLTEGENYLIRGTVKEHNRYKGVNQTVLTRCMLR